ncbi:MAG: hypothetical protein K9J81_03885 [Desulfohalobiaceae bacterium]|nr:hypothetical protein [Desulfohalobiaceae bacterium]
MWRFHQEAQPVSCPELGAMSDSSRQSITYFSAEYGLHHSLPFYAGGLGFLENYDEQFAQYMLHGVYVWLNNPVPPMEASGTSGMKAAVNGVPQGWVRVMKEAIRSNASRFSSRRMVKEYLETLYAPAMKDRNG